MIKLKNLLIASMVLMLAACGTENSYTGSETESATSLGRAITLDEAQSKDNGEINEQVKEYFEQMESYISDLLGDHLELGNGLPVDPEKLKEFAMVCEGLGEKDLEDLKAKIEEFLSLIDKDELFSGLVPEVCRRDGFEGIDISDLVDSYKKEKDKSEGAGQHEAGENRCVGCHLGDVSWFDDILSGGINIDHEGLRGH